MPRPSATFGEPIRTIFLPKGDSAPSEDIVNTLVSTAKEHQGLDVELSWALSGCTNSMRLMARWLKGETLPSLKLTEIDGHDRTVVWSGDTVDLRSVSEIVSKYSAALFRTDEAPQMEAEANDSDDEDPVDDWVDESGDDEQQEQANELDFLGEAVTSVQVLSDQLINLSTGFYSFSALLRFLEREFYRFDAYAAPVSLVIFEINHPTIPIPLQAISTAALRIEMIMRPSDLAGHFEAHDYALLLPDTQRPTASLIANKVLQVLTAGPLAPGLDKGTIKVSFGIATLPDDGDDLESLIKSAKAAKMKAKEHALSLESQLA